MPPCLARRYEHVLLCFLAVFSSYLIRTILSTTLVGGAGMSAELGWSPFENGVLLSAFFWGYFLGNAPGGLLASKIGGKPVLMVSCSVQCLLSLASPVVARWGFYQFFILRFIVGLLQGPLYPCTQTILVAWLSPEERARGNSIMDSGSYWGAAFALGIGNVLQNNLGSWDKVFYAYAAVIGVYVVLMWFRMQSYPGQEEEEEAPYQLVEVANERADDAGKASVPWKELFLNRAAFAAIVAPLSMNWGNYMFLTNLPKYAQEELHFNLSDGSKSGILVIPYLCCWVFGLASAFGADHFIQTGAMSITTVRKLFQTLASTLACVSLVLLATTSDSTVVILLLCVIISSCGIGASGSTASPMDLSKQYAGLIKGVANSIGTIGGCAAPILVGYMLQNGGCPSDETFKVNRSIALVQAESASCKSAWNWLFYIAAFISFLGGLCFLLFASGEPIVLSRDNHKAQVGDTAYQVFDGEEGEQRVGNA